MNGNKKLKAAIRDRMARSNECYTDARMHVLAELARTQPVGTPIDWLQNLQQASSGLMRLVERSEMMTTIGALGNAVRQSDGLRRFFETMQGIERAIVGSDLLKQVNAVHRYVMQSERLSQIMNAAQLLSERLAEPRVIERLRLIDAQVKSFVDPIVYLDPPTRLTRIERRLRIADEGHTPDSD